MIDSFRPYYNSFIEDLDGLLRIPSVLDKYDKDNLLMPFGKGNKDALDYMLKLGEKDGFRVQNIDNYGGFVEFGEGEKVLLILCHLDVVPATGRWDTPPFEPVIKDNRIYARGSIDDKGPLMATYYALKMLKDNDFKPNMRIRFFFGCDEESGSRCLERYIEKYGECDYGFSPDALFPLIYAEKGISTILFKGEVSDDEIISFKSGTASNIVPDYAVATLKSLDLEEEFNQFLKENSLKGKKNSKTYELYGKAAHGSTPEAGINAATYLALFLEKYIKNEFTCFIKNHLHIDYYAEKLGVDYIDDEMGKVSSNPSVYELKDKKFYIVNNLRYPKGFEFEEAIKKLDNLMKKYNGKVEALSNSKYHYVPKHSHLVQALLKAYRDYTGDNSDAISIGGGTYARDFKNAVAFGPMFMNEKETMHMPNESADIDNLITASFIYQEAIKHLCD